MKRNLFFTLFAIALIVAGAAVAQQHGGPGGTPPAGPQSVISGPVVSFSAGAGQGMPSLVIQQAGGNVTLVLGPFWFLQNAQFTAAVGDSIEATVMSCSDCPNGYAVIAVRNATNGTSVTLRNSDGLPLWTSQRTGRGMAPGFGGRGPGNGAGRGPSNGCNGSGPDMTQVATFSGTVKSFEGGPGVGRPTLVLQTVEGDRTFIVAPYRVVLASGLEFIDGAAITLTAAPNVNGEWVVITIRDSATGAELVLRDAQTGRPIGGRGHC